MQNPSIHRTERKLILIFVIGASLFLILFELFFIGTRLLLEERFQKEEFMSQIKAIVENKSPIEKHKRPKPPQLGINSIIIDDTGKIIDIRGNIDMSKFTEFIDITTLISLPIDTITTYYETLFIKKKQLIGNKEYSVIFFKKSGYPLEDILRDITRFLIMNILLIVPFYFIGHYYVRRTLRPIAENIDTMSHFIHDAGHELKTPLAIVSGNLQLLRDSNLNDKSIIEESITTIHTMGDSIDGLIELANLQRPTNTVTLKLKENIEEILLHHYEQIEQKKITLTLDISEFAQISMEKKHFQILFSNLITNAIRYNKDSGSISIILKGRKLSIIDTGIGMTEAESKKIFERFYRADRSGRIPGTGIGLTIVDRIIHLYGWSMDVKSEKGVGTSFIIDIG